MRTRFIVLDGPDGSGTTLHCALLGDALQHAGTPVLRTMEPTEGPIGRFIRQLLTEKRIGSPAALQLLFCADRAWHADREIVPALTEGRTVISDRYWLSTVAYGEALGLDGAWLASLNKKFIQPDTTILLLPPLSVCMERIGRRPGKDALETQELQERVHDAYHRMAQADPRLHIVDTSGSKEETAKKIRNIVDKL